MVVHPIYDHFFPLQGPAPNDWTPFSNYEPYWTQERGTPDLSISTPWVWTDTALKISLTLAQIVIFPWGLYIASRALVGRLIMAIACPAQMDTLFSYEKIERLRVLIQEQAEALPDLILREVVLEKEGTRYNGLLLGVRNVVGNGKWALFAGGNNATIESSVLTGGIIPYLRAGYNALLVNGPGVGKSEGWATAEGMGDAQELGLSFLESAVKAKQIVLAGHSLGAASIGAAILQHTFRPDIQYFVIRMMTFSRLSDIVRKVRDSFAAALISWSNSEMDSVEASKKLQAERIHELIIQAGNDEVMQGVDLLEALQNDGLMENKTGLLIPEAGHCDLPRQTITEEIRRWENAF